MKTRAVLFQAGPLAEHVALGTVPALPFGNDPSLQRIAFDAGECWIRQTCWPIAPGIRTVLLTVPSGR
jgi:hypothetical protein